MNEKVSIIIPAFNCNKTIERCIESVLNQTYSKLEIIVINDGSNDNTLDKIEKYNKKILIINKENTGPSETRNIGIDKATGKYVFFLDSDDYLHPKAIEILLKQISDDIDIVRCNYYFVKNKKILMNNKFPSFKEVNSKEMLNKYMMQNSIWNTVWGQLIKMEHCKKVRFDKNIRIGEDLLFNYQLYSKIKMIKCINLPLYYYVDNYNSITRALNSSSIKKNMNDIKKNYEFLYEKIKEENSKKFIVERCIQSIMSYQRQLVFISFFKEKDFITNFNENKIINKFLFLYSSKKYKIDIFFNKHKLYILYIIYIILTYVPLKFIKEFFKRIRTNID